MGLPAASKETIALRFQESFETNAGELHTFAAAFPIHTCSALFTRLLPARSYTEISSSVRKSTAT